MAASALLMSSCGIYTHYKPVQETPEQLYGQEVAADDTASIADQSWREVFTDPHLQALIEQGLSANTDYLSALQRVKEAEATLISARLAYLPSLALAPQGTVSSWDHGKATQTYSLPVTASWEFDLFGKLRNAERQQKALLAYSQDYSQAVRTQVIAGIANVYYTLLMLDEQIDITTRTAQSWKESAAATRALMKAGMADEASAAQMEAAALSAEAQVLTLKEQRNTTRNSLSALLAETPRDYERGTLAGQDYPDHLQAGIPLQLLSRRPDVRAAERSLERAFYATNSARAAFYPSITLSGSAGWSNSGGGMIANPGKFLASAVASLTQPLFAQGKLVGQLKIARAQQEEARLAFQQTLLNAGMEVNEALDKWQTAREKTELYARQVEKLQTAYNSTQLKMQYGNTTYLEVLTAQQSLLGAELTQVANRMTELQGKIDLYQALGGGGTD